MCSIRPSPGREDARSSAGGLRGSQVLQVGVARIVAQAELLKSASFFVAAVGGCLVFPKYRIAVDIRSQDVLLCDVHEYHGNSPITGDYYFVPSADALAARGANERTDPPQEPD